MTTTTTHTITTYNDDGSVTIKVTETKELKNPGGTVISTHDVTLMEETINVHPDDEDDDDGEVDPDKVKTDTTVTTETDQDGN